MNRSVVAIGVLAIITGAGYLVFTPHLYEASCILNVERNAEGSVFGALGLIQRRLPYKGYFSDAYFYATEFETILAKPVISNAVRIAKLENGWGPQTDQGENWPKVDMELAKYARAHATVRDLRQQGMVAVTVRSPQPVEAMTLANSIARAYLEFRRSRLEEGLREAKIEHLKELAVHADSTLSLREDLPVSAMDIAQAKSLIEAAIEYKETRREFTVPLPTMMRASAVLPERPAQPSYLVASVLMLSGGLLCVAGITPFWGKGS